MNPANLKDYEIAYLVAVRDGKRVGWHEAAARSTMLIAGYSTWDPSNDEERLTEKGLELLAAHERRCKLRELLRRYANEVQGSAIDLRTMTPCKADCLACQSRISRMGEIETEIVALAAHETKP